MFNLKKVIKARKRLKLLTALLFKLFQMNLRYKEKRGEYGLEIFEYFYLPWRTEIDFNNSYKMINEHTLNPKSRLYTIHELSKRYLVENSSFIEVGTWKGGVCGLVSFSNPSKNIDIIACDSFTGVKNSGKNDTFFQNDEYSDATIEDLIELSKITPHKIKVIKGIFPDSVKSTTFTKNISMAHIDVDTYISAKQSFDYISERLIPGGVVVLDDYGGWFTDGVTKFGNELKNDSRFYCIPNHLGQMVIFKK